MSKQNTAFVIALLFAMFAHSAQAFFDPPWVTPAAPRGGEIVSLNIHGGICDVFVEWQGYPQITRNGNAIRIVKYGNHETFEDLCIYGLWTVTEPIGTFTPGDYSLTVDLAYDDALYGPTITTLGVIPFTVTGVTPAKSVPTTNLAGLLALSLLMPSLAIWRRRKWSD